MFSPRIFAVAIALFLTGCVTYIGNGGMADTVGSHLNYVTKSGRLAVMVLGDPVPGKRAEIEAMVISALDNNFATLKTTFVATKLIVPPPDKILFVFDPEITALGSEMCHAPAAAKAGLWKSALTGSDPARKPPMAGPAINPSPKAAPMIPIPWARFSRVVMSAT